MLTEPQAEAHRRLVAHYSHFFSEPSTDSDHGREVVRPLDPWPHSEAGRSTA